MMELGNDHEEGGGGGGNGNGNGKTGGGSNSNSRQSSSRWTPTTEQIRILKELYYNNGVRSPSAEQIQRISAKLRQYGKIEGKNVFYWFQNHKARERQKNRFTTPIPALSPPLNWKNNIIIQDHHHHHHHVSPIYNNFSNNKTTPAGNFASSSTTTCSARGLFTVGNYAMEKSFRECSITPSHVNNGGGGGSMGQKFAWIDPYPNFIEKRKCNINNNGTDHYQTLEIHNDDQDEEEEDREIETLPLFPMHGGDDDDDDEDMKQLQQQNDYYFNAHSSSSSNIDMYDPRASLELTLNSYYSPTSFNFFK